MRSVSLPPAFSLTKPVARVSALTLWLVFAALYIGLFLIDHYVDYHEMLEPCDVEWRLGATTCNWIALSSAEEAALASVGLTLRHYAVAMIVGSMLMLTTYVTLALVILWRRGTTRIGLLVALCLVGIPYAMFSGSRIWSGIHPSLVFPGEIANALGNLSQIAFLYLLPNGRFSPRWAYIPMFTTFFLLSTVSLYNNGIVTLPEGGMSVLVPALLVLVLFGAVLQIYRYVRESNAVERQQTRWIILGVAAYATSIMLWVLVFGRVLDIPLGLPRVIANVVDWYVETALLCVLPIAITVAILRYKLWNIDLIINRALVLAGLTAIIVAIYSVIVGGLGAVFQASGNFFISLLATAMVAVLFQPARDRLQGAVNRLVFGERDNPYVVLSRLSQQLQTATVPREALTTMVETIAKTLKLPFVAVELVEHEKQIGNAAVGQAAAQALDYPLNYQQETVGRLRVSPRAGEDDFSPREQQLLRDIAAQLGPVASATRLTLALQNSREQLVVAREEERRRIRRDLHDGLGPTLAAQALKLDTVLESLTENDIRNAERHVEQLKSQTQQMVADIRRLVYELRPPALDELGLVEALSAHFAQMTGRSGSLLISLDSTPDPLPPLPAAVEVAAYRIALEGVMNVVRHAKAQHCQVRFAVSEDEQLAKLTLTVVDDGVGISRTPHAGVGLRSMLERAQELGGTCDVTAHPQAGTCVTAALPFVVRSQI